MSKHENRHRAAAICESCDRFLSVQVWRDGTVRPIANGAGTACLCGGTVFRLLSDDDEVHAVVGEE